MIKLNDLAIGYNGEAILEHIDQEFDDGLIYGILAKSGAGKTTLLKTISGLLHPVHGEVVIDGTAYRNADKNPVYMMHQRYSNFGWLSCTENVLIAQRDKKLRSRDDAIKVLAAVGLEQYADKWPSQLSGGMQQRLALARTLYVKPKYLLMDEPLSALDDKTRSKMQRLILDVHAETGNTIIMVTHSQDEAFKQEIVNVADTAQFKNPEEAYAIMDEFVSIANTLDGAIIQVEGNINARNYSDSGQALSAERAKAVAKYFIACGIDPNRLITVGNGNTKMVADPGSADAYLNRRTDVFFKIIEE